MSWVDQCIPIEPTDCFKATLRCIGVSDLESLDQLMDSMLQELNDLLFKEAIEVIEGILKQISKLLTKMNSMIAEIASIYNVLNMMDPCVIDVVRKELTDAGFPPPAGHPTLVEAIQQCPAVGALADLLRARATELYRQVLVIERSLDPLFGLPYQLSRFVATLAGMFCAVANAETTKEVIAEILAPPIPPIPPPICP